MEDGPSLNLSVNFFTVENVGVDSFDVESNPNCLPVGFKPIISKCFISTLSPNTFTRLIFSNTTINKLKKDD